MLDSMLLRDQHGEIEVPFITDFEYKDASLTVICPAAEPICGMPAIWCRLQKGVLELKGVRFQISESGHRPVLPFAPELVAQQVRLSRMGGLHIVPDRANLQRPAPEGNAGRRARTRKDQSNQSERNQSLFD
jgi:hypothetical protein